MITSSQNITISIRVWEIMHFDLLLANFGQVLLLLSAHFNVKLAILCQMSFTKYHFKIEN